jgi:hypothetical protein
LNELDGEFNADYKRSVKLSAELSMLRQEHRFSTGGIMAQSITRLMLAFFAFSVSLGGLTTREAGAADAVAPQASPRGAARAQDGLALQESAPDRYIVEKGDTLWSIAGRFLKDPWKWPQIWRLNEDQVRNPHRIYPGNVIVLDRTKNPPQLALLPEDTIKLSPRIYEEPVLSAIPAIPPNQIEQFLTQPLVIEQGGLEKAPRVVATEESRFNIGPGGLAYVSGLADSKQLAWQIFRPGRSLVDPDTGRSLGIEAVFLGTGRIVRTGDPATLQVTSARQEIGNGDRLIAVNEPALVQYVPRAPSGLVQARIISLYDRLPTSEGGRTSVVSLNKGRRDGLENGHVLAIFRSGSTVSTGPRKGREPAPSVKLPDERYGLVFVFRTFDAVSYALVMDSSRPVEPGDRVQTP